MSVYGPELVVRSLVPHVSLTCMLQNWPLRHTTSLWYPGIFLVEKYFLEKLL